MGHHAHNVQRQRPPHHKFHFDQQQSLAIRQRRGFSTKMLVTELQNQDPTQPMSNTDLMNQVSQIRRSTATQQLTSTLQSVALGQSIASAGSLIGATVTGTDSNGNSVSGTVNSASISNGSAVLNVGKFEHRPDERDPDCTGRRSSSSNGSKRVSGSPGRLSDHENESGSVLRERQRDKLRSP